MPCCRGLAACLAVLLLSGGMVHAVPAQKAPPTAAQWRDMQLRAADKADRLMREADTRKSLLGRYEAMLAAASQGDANPAFAIIIGQYLSWYETFIGDYPNAAANFSIQELPQPDDRPLPPDGEAQARPAIEAISELARGRQAVFLNEAHHLPLTRTLTVQLLARLREEGFDTFAAETLYASDGHLAERGYPVEGTGFYTREPICAEMVRTALRLGYRVVAYEAESETSGDARESRQARNLYERVFERDPHARLVLDAGYGHIQEAGTYLGGRSMAEYFRRISGIDPLTVDQVMLIPHPDPTHDHPDYTAVMKQLAPKEPLVFMQAGKPWALRAGYDVSVFFPPQVLRLGRPTWLALGGLRRPYPVRGEEICRGEYPCLVEARYASEGDDAIAADRLAFDPPPRYGPPDVGLRPAGGASIGELYLRPGKYRLLATDAQGHPLGRRTITVSP
ncbi:hypothetical protein [Fulvimonas yonginensis]|uniref:Uncharacterized protein n=1 Tax=Fulvimonas yonginensis TaxID=1495200 RepID=A0ABU8JF93_9GAMM